MAWPATLLCSDRPLACSHQYMERPSTSPTHISANYLLSALNHLLGTCRVHLVRSDVIAHQHKDSVCSLCNTALPTKLLGTTNTAVFFSNHVTHLSSLSLMILHLFSAARKSSTPSTNMHLSRFLAPASNLTHGCMGLFPGRHLG